MRRWGRWGEGGDGEDGNRISEFGGSQNVLTAKKLAVITLLSFWSEKKAFAIIIKNIAK